MDSQGFTLIELLVVVLMIGILAGIAIPYYLKAVESSKANNAVALANMVGTANRMYAEDHSGAYVSGTLTDALCTGTSSDCSSTGANGVCDLIYCGYLAQQDWDSNPYQVAAVNPTAGGGSCPIGSCMSADLVACAVRRTTGSAGTTTSPYNEWGYVVNINGGLNGGNIGSCEEAPTPPQ